VGIKKLYLTEAHKNLHINTYEEITHHHNTKLHTLAITIFSISQVQIWTYSPFNLIKTLHCFSQSLQENAEECGYFH